MPNKDGTGPRGQGPGSGRLRGRCAGAAETGGVGRRGLGKGRGRGSRAGAGIRRGSGGGLRGLINPEDGTAR